MTTISDDFNRADSDSLGASWTEAAGNLAINGNALAFQTSGFENNIAVYSGTSLSGVEQYAKITLSALPASQAFPFIVFRYTNSSSPFYAITIDRGFGVTWSTYSAADGSSTEIDNADIPVAEGDTWGVTVSGTGDNTVVRAWQNPTGDAPDSADSWGSDTTPQATFTTNPSANAVDTGVLVGLGAVHNQAANAVKVDNFFAGDIGSGGGGESILLQMLLNH